MTDIQYQINEQQKADANEVARRTAFDRKVASSLPRPSHEIADEARFEAEKRKLHPLPGDPGYVSVKATHDEREADKNAAKRRANPDAEKKAPGSPNNQRKSSAMSENDKKFSDQNTPDRNNETKRDDGKTGRDAQQATEKNNPGKTGVLPGEVDPNRGTK